jgi:two-component system OmpR family sensor kinase
MHDLFRHTRLRLTVIYSSLFLLVAGVLAAAFWVLFVEREYGTVDDSLRSQADVLRATLPHAPPVGDITLPSQTTRGVAIASYLFAAGGAPVAQSHNASDVAFARAQIPKSGFPAHSEFFTADNSSGEVRILVRRVDFDGSTGGIVLERPIEELHDRLVTTALLLLAVVGTLVICASALAYWLSGRALRPVREIAAAAREISEHDLNRRIEIDLPPSDELGELAGTFNEMLTRLEAGFQTLQRFTADAAHELRAPLALMRTQIEVILRQRRTPEEYASSHAAVLKEIKRMSRTVDQLLLLARADAGELVISGRLFDLPDLLEESVARWGRHARDREIALQATIPSDGRISGDPDLLGRIIDNLLDNAIRHTPAGGSIALNCRARADEWEISVSDSGPGVGAVDRPHIFDRFYRGDKARRRAEGNAGLGLSLSAMIAGLHRGRLWLANDPSPLGGAQFVLTLPRPPRSAPTVPHQERVAVPG